MSNFKKLLMSGGGGDEGPLNVQDVFSCDPNSNTDGTSYTITNNIDLAGKGGLIWSKCRSAQPKNHVLVDTVRGLNKYVSTNTFADEVTATNTVTAVSDTGFTYGTDSNVNVSGNNRAIHWTFRKAENFFDIQTYSGNGVSGRTISHSLGAVPGCVIIKRLDGGSIPNWPVYHRELGEGTFTNPEDYYMRLNTVDGVFPDSTGGKWNSTAPTSTTITLGSDEDVNASGGEYVAYIFAHHDGTGTFGENGDQDIIRCGRLVGDNTMQDIELGFEAQWFFTKRMNGTDEDWKVVDDVRGLSIDNDPFLSLNTGDSEGATGRYRPYADGFKMDESSDVQIIYIAIRRVMDPVVEDSSDVFAIDTSQATPPSWRAPFKVDAAWIKNVATSLNPQLLTRKSNTLSRRFNIGAEDRFGTLYRMWEFTDGWYNTSNLQTNFYSYMWRRAPGFFDLQTYTGNGTQGTAHKHNLGVTPEMMIASNMTDSGVPAMYHKDLAGTVAGLPAYSHYFEMSEYDAAKADNAYWSGAPTSTEFTVGSRTSTNFSNDRYAIMLFASLAGVCKVGTYTGTGGTQTIDCGFSNGVKFLLIKSVSVSGFFFVLDSERGINTGAADPFWITQDAGPQDTRYQVAEQDSSGFKVVDDTGLGSFSSNSSTVKYVYYAVAAP